MEDQRFMQPVPYFKKYAFMMWLWWTEEEHHNLWRMATPLIVLIYPIVYAFDKSLRESAIWLYNYHHRERESYLPDDAGTIHDAKLTVTYEDQGNITNVSITSKQ